MNEEFLVNNKTDILEFKRKHNKLVGAVPKKNTDGNYKIFENIVDAQGHKRFIEGNLEFNQSSNIETIYGKWSLSGSHLLIVMSGKIPAGTSVSASTISDISSIPKWIKDKITPIVSNRVALTTTTAFDENYNPVTMSFIIGKINDLFINSLAAFAEKEVDYYFRFHFDLLIDNEEPEIQGE